MTKIYYQPIPCACPSASGLSAGLVVQLSQLAREGPKRMKEREQRFRRRGLQHSGNAGSSSADEEEMESASGTLVECRDPCSSSSCMLSHEHVGLENLTGYSSF
jgi:hypothetical protein